MHNTQSYKRFFSLICIYLLLIILDQSTKIYVARVMLNNRFENIEIFSFLNITFVRNTGISFGLFSNGGLLNRYFFTILALIVGLTLLIIAFLNIDRIARFSLLFISAGAIGNAIDRIYFGGVIDFIDFFYIIYIGLHLIWQIYLLLGVILLLFENFLEKNKNAKNINY